MCLEKDVFGPDNAEIIGISTDSVEKQKAFVEEQKLTVWIAYWKFCRADLSGL